MTEQEFLEIYSESPCDSDEIRWEVRNMGGKWIELSEAYFAAKDAIDEALLNLDGFEWG